MKFRLADIVNHIFFTWFDEMTSRFWKVSLLIGGISIILSSAFLIQSLSTKSKPIPVQEFTQQSRPNIIFIVVDALAVKDMSMFGFSLPTTPNLNQITQTWTVFSNAQAPTTCTILALPSLMTGRYPYTNNIYNYGDQINGQPGWLSMPNVLEQNGYQTWWSGYLSPGLYHMDQVFQENACHANENLLNSLIYSRFEGRALWFAGFPFIPFTLDRSGFVQRLMLDFDSCTELDPLSNLIQNQTTAPPFFIYYHYRGVHGQPYAYPSGKALGEFLSTSEGLISPEEQIPLQGFYKIEDQPLVDKLRLRYDEAIADQDRILANFIESLKQQGVYDSAMIIIMGDHGQNFENGFSTHCTPLISDAEANVPLLVKYPFQSVGQRFNFPVSTIDVAPTILEAAGLKFPENWFDGISLIEQAAQEESNRIVFTRRYSNNLNLLPLEIAATDGKYRLVMRSTGLFLFDIQKDPSEKVNLLEVSTYDQRPEVQKLKQALDNYRQRALFLLDGGKILSAPPLKMDTPNLP